MDAALSFNSAVRDVLPFWRRSLAERQQFQ